MKKQNLGFQSCIQVKIIPEEEELESFSSAGLKILEENIFIERQLNITFGEFLT